ncbi:MAG: GNAT family N-acetyltransferase [Lachnospiraceae bacterium]|nr:GNAT family N-acetyltransferase [Lachnospiraceae bacterium]MEE3461423.1 GNAT family N-acetyltransferase [Lachnospiraceae bacterium]
MVIRKMEERDIAGVNKLLKQVNKIHHDGRPDLFRLANKYTDEELAEKAHNEIDPVFVAVKDDDSVDPASEDNVLGYAICYFKDTRPDHMLTDITGIYIDDLCVDEKLRGHHIGRMLYDHVCKYAKEKGCYNVTLNVWECNPSAHRFYEAVGLKPQKYCMEHIL